MNRKLRIFVWAVSVAAVVALAIVPARSGNAAARDSFRALAFYTAKGEPDHVAFATQAIAFFTEHGKKDGYEFSATTNWDELTAEKLKDVRVVVWLNDFPHTAVQRGVFEAYMKGGGAWLGFHVSAYNDESTGWPWFVEFLGGGVFYGNNWPPLPAKLEVEDATHPVTKGFPATFVSPTNEWYIWKPSPRLNKDVRVLATLDPSNYPIGLKDVITAGDLPVVWTNTRYHMVYMNMGHGEKVLDSEQQNTMIENAILWLGRGK